MLEVKDELLFDFGINQPRVLVTDKLVIIDEVSRLIDFTDQTVITVSGKSFYTVVNGSGLLISSFQNSRLVCSGSVDSVEFHKNKVGEGLKHEG